MTHGSCTLSRKAKGKGAQAKRQSLGRKERGLPFHVYISPERMQEQARGEWLVETQTGPFLGGIEL